ncbi:MAG: YchJ family metal-binding protein [Gammaproteobacteria bacterium]|nr:YchJ family metal-binding protein [Gammaproteobacteria bacterium]MDH5653750.1 YchJ family metal-binding protein [Gammaproteobacteria bacterium]
MQAPETCPCGSDQAYMQCCGLVHKTDVVADTPEALMRSRYTAYVVNDEAYLLRTWHPSTRPAVLDLHAEGSPQWIGLKIVSKVAGGVGDETGTVEFVARYKINGKAHRLQEKSRFVRENGEWFYVDGEIKT